MKHGFENKNGKDAGGFHPRAAMRIQRSSERGTHEVRFEEKEG
jgi:hypothetical protein